MPGVPRSSRLTSVPLVEPCAGPLLGVCTMKPNVALNLGGSMDITVGDLFAYAEGAKKLMDLQVGSCIAYQMPEDRVIEQGLDENQFHWQPSTVTAIDGDKITTAHGDTIIISQVLTPF